MKTPENFSTTETWWKRKTRKIHFEVEECLVFAWHSGTERQVTFQPPIRVCFTAVLDTCQR